MMLSQYRDALKDAKKCIELDPQMVKVDISIFFYNAWLFVLVNISIFSLSLQAYTRLVKCSLVLGDVVEAETTIEKLAQIEPSKQSVTTEMNDISILKRYLREAEVAYNAKDYRKVDFYSFTYIFTNGCTLFFKLTTKNLLSCRLFIAWIGATKLAHFVLGSKSRKPSASLTWEDMLKQK